MEHEFQVECDAYFYSDEASDVIIFLVSDSHMRVPLMVPREGIVDLNIALCRDEKILPGRIEDIILRTRRDGSIVTNVSMLHWDREKEEFVTSVHLMRNQEQTTVIYCIPLEGVLLATYLNLPILIADEAIEAQAATDFFLAVMEAYEVGMHGAF